MTEGYQQEMRLGLGEEQEGGKPKGKKIPHLSLNEALTLCLTI